VETLNVGDTASPPANTRTSGLPDSGSHRIRSGSEDLPRYQQAERMEARLWPEQIQALGNLRRQLMRTRTVRGVRITDNTLLRIAVDLLMANAD